MSEDLLHYQELSLRHQKLTKEFSGWLFQGLGGLHYLLHLHHAARHIICASTRTSGSYTIPANPAGRTEFMSSSAKREKPRVPSTSKLEGLEQYRDLDSIVLSLSDG
jgi:hypothetical protein